MPAKTQKQKVSRKTARVGETQLEFHVRLPAGENAEEFADKLIEAVGFVETRHVGPY